MLKTIQGFFDLVFLKDFMFLCKPLYALSIASRRLSLYRGVCSLSVCSLVQTQTDGQVLKGIGKGTVKDSHVKKTSSINIFLCRDNFFNHSKHAYHLSQHFKLAKKGVKITAMPTLLSV